jgi:protein regulator of cytokinesis 1
MTDDSLELGAFNLSPSYYEQLEQEFERVYQEFTRRVSMVEALAKEIINLYAELGIPKAQIDRSIMEYGTTEPDRLGLMREDIERLRGKKTKLLDERQRRRAEADEIKKEIKGLWLKLGIAESDEKQFLAQHRGCDLKCIQEVRTQSQVDCSGS